MQGMRFCWRCEKDLGGTLAVLRDILEAVGGSWGHLGSPLGTLWKPLGTLWKLFGTFGGFFGTFW